MQLSPCSPLRDVIFHSIKRRCRVQIPLRPEMRFKLHQQRIAFDPVRAIHGYASLIVRNRSRNRAKFRAGEPA